VNTSGNKLKKRGTGDLQIHAEQRQMPRVLRQTLLKQRIILISSRP
jgi:hypothetical protein